MRELNLLLSRFVRVKLNSSVFLVKQNPSWDLLQEGDDVYEETIRSLRFDGWISEGDAVSIAIQRGLLDSDFKAREESARKTLENTQVKLFLERSNPVAVKTNRAKIAAIRSSLDKAQAVLCSIEGHSLEGHARNCRDSFIFSRLIYSPKGKRISPQNSEDIRRAYWTKMGAVGSIRAIARSQHWRIIWGAKKGGVFKVLPLNELQMQLAYFAKFYDGVFKHPDMPSPEVINDDDMLDGWMIYTNKDDKDKEKISPKVARHKEVFVMAKNREEAEEIWNSNDQDALNKMKQRQAQVNKGGKPIQHSQLRDVKQDYVRQHTR